MENNPWRKEIERLENNDIKSYEYNPWKSEIERLINDETIKEDKNEKEGFESRNDSSD